MTRLAWATAAAAVLTAPAAMAQGAPVSFGTNWVAEAEHGGYYQAVADGTYAACGLDVTIVPGGPQVNNRALMLAGKIDYHMGGDLLNAFNAAKEGVPVVAVAATFQKHPQVIVTHPGKAKTFEDLKKLNLFIAESSLPSFYQWMMAAYGFTMEQRLPYNFNPAPFVADENTGMQGYLTSEPYAVEKEGGFVPDVFLIADAGYSTYSTTIETMADTVATKPEQVACFVDGSARGWYTYLYGDRSKADAMILSDNPDMTQAQIDYSVAKMKEYGIVDSGDALTLGIGAMTDEKVADFYDKMVKAGVMEPGLDYKASYTTQFVNKGVGMDLKPAN